MAKGSKVTAKPETTFSDRPASGPTEPLISKGETALAAQPNTAAPTNAAVETSGPAVVEHVPDAPSPGAAAGTNSTDNPPSEDRQGGAGNAAGSGESLTLEDLDKRLGTAEDEFRTKFPHFSAAIEAWKAEHGYETPAGLRIKSKVEGFRRAGIAHPKAPVDHPVEAFKEPEQLEALFAEPNLTVELI